MPPEKKTERLLLVGPMGVGKTTLGKMLAEETGRRFMDSDQEVERRAGADIPWIFDMEGESGFRERETAVLQEARQLPNLVLATGGGAVLRETNRRLLRDAGFVIHLDASLELLLERTAKDRNRPLLQGGNPREALGRLLQERERLYRSVADMRLELDADDSKRQTLTRLLDSLRGKGQDP